MQRVLKGSTETIFTYPPTLAQASGTPTARVGTPSSGLPAPGAGTNCTVDTLSSSLTVNAAEGSTRLTVASAAWVKGRKYLLTATTGEIIVVESLTSGTTTTLDIKEPLPRDVASTSTIVGWRISVALTADQTSSIGRAVVEWTATINSVGEAWADSFEVVHIDGGYSLTADRLTILSPYCKRMRPDSDEDFREVIEAAWARHVEVPLLAKGLSPSRVVSRDVLEALHVTACELFLAEQFDPALVEQRRGAFADALTLVLNSKDLWVSTSDSLSSPDNSPQPWSFCVVSR